MKRIVERMSVGENSRRLVLGLVSTMAAGVLFSATAAEPVPVVDWAEPAGWHAAEPGKVVSDGAIVTVRQPGISSRTFPHYPLDDGRDLDRTYQGISFRVRGDGSDEWGCININNGSRFGGAFYFPVKNTDWMEYRVAFADMAPISDHACGLPRNVAAGDLGRARLIADLGEAGKRVRYAEAYEWSPYGCRNSGDVEELRRLLTV